MKQRYVKETRLVDGVKIHRFRLKITPTLMRETKQMRVADLYSNLVWVLRALHLQQRIPWSLEEFQ